MIPLFMVLGYVGGAVLGVLVSIAAWYVGVPLGGFEIVLLAAALGGVGSLALGGLAWRLVPEAVRNIVKSWRKGFLVVAIGRDGKAYLLPAESDGYKLQPVDKRFQRYRWATDGSSLHPVHGGRGLQLAIAYMGSSNVVDGKMAAAATKYAEMGYLTVDDLKTALELPSPEAVEERIKSLESALDEIRGMDPESVEQRFGMPRDAVEARIRAELDRLYRILDLARKHGGGPPPVVIDGTVVRAEDVVRYFAWKTDPILVERMVVAETNAAYELHGKWRQIAPYMGLVAVVGIVVIGVLIVAHMILGGQPGPEALPNVVQNVSSIVNASVVPVNGTLPVNATG